MTPSDDATLTVASEPDSSEDRQYTVDGLDDATTYDIALFPAENVSVGADGVVAFTDSASPADEADGAGETHAAITVVNGTSRGTDAAADDQLEASPVSGQISFTVDYDGAEGPESVVPVIWVDDEATTGLSEGELDLDADNAPVEDFGVGGETAWVPGEADGGAFDVDVTQVDKDGNSFVADNDTATDGDGGGDANTGDSEGTFFYDSNDSYIVDGEPSTMAQFEANLSAGDDVSGTYATDPDASSTFNLTDTTPSDTENVAAEADSDTQVTVTWDNPVGARNPVAAVRRRFGTR